MLAAGLQLGAGRRLHPAQAAGQACVLRIQNAGYDGTKPGPALQVRRGEDIWVRAINETAESTAIHWHGVRLVNAMDGAPGLTQAPIAPGQSFDYRFNAPDAGTFWYHPAPRTNAGLYGAFIVTETEPLDIDQDITLIFAPDTSGTTGFTINDASHLEIRARANERLRLRLINVDTSRILHLRIADLRVFVMATDGQPAQPFVARDGALTLGPGNRIDVFVDCSLASGTSVPVTVESGNGDGAAIAEIVCGVGTRLSPRPEPKPLPTNPLPDRIGFARAYRLDAALGEPRQTPIFTVDRGRSVVLGLSNPTSKICRIHLHGHSFRLLDAWDDAWKPFWLDTMPMAPQAKARIAFVADNPGRWVIEGLSGGGAEAWFEVT
jgi:FtsP/CotA-like multicopper oxidase with cupredoxin domain